MESTQRIDKHKAEVYKTTHYSPEQVAHLKESATRQDKAVARIYFNHYPQGLTPSEAHEKIKEKARIEGSKKEEPWPKSSTKRSVTGLTKAGILEMTEETRIGPWGRPEHIWKWKAPEEWKQGEMFGGPQPNSRSGAYSQ